MCGIYAVQGKRASERVFEGLKRLEYRGYDSWGIAALKENEINVHKQAGSIPSSSSKLFTNSTTAIGHTRWATHGGVTKINAHPHQAADESFSVVHNGVVENYQELKQALLADGAKFVSETDTEVIVRLIENQLNNSAHEDQAKRKLNIDIIINAFKLLEGRNTIAVLENDGSIFAVRNGSPLIIAKNDDGEIFLSSDTLSVAADADSFIAVENQVALQISENEVFLRDVKTNKQLPISFEPLTVEMAEVDHDGFPSFMEKEIHEQAEVLARVEQNPQELFEQLSTRLRGAKQIWLVGAGSAYFAAGQISHYLREAGLFATAVPAYEARTFLPTMTKDDLVIAVSQSGETADTIEVVEWIKDKNIPLASIVNMVGSTLTKLADFPFMLSVGPEIAVASTKAFLGQVVWGKVLAEYIKSDLRKTEIKEKINNFEQKLSEWLGNNQIQNITQNIAANLVDKRDVFLLGRGGLYFAALEGALKLKEISYIHAEGFSGGELKHGVIALIEEGTPVFALVAEDEEKPAMLSAAAEISARGGKVIGVSPSNNELFDEWLPIPDDDFLGMAAAVVPFQLLTCKIAKLKGRNPDKPRNLAKSVTVK